MKTLICPECKGDIWFEEDVKPEICPHCGALIPKSGYSSEDADDGFINTMKKSVPSNPFGYYFSPRVGKNILAWLEPLYRERKPHPVVLSQNMVNNMIKLKIATLSEPSQEMKDTYGARHWGIDIVDLIVYGQHYACIITKPLQPLNPS